MKQKSYRCTIGIKLNQLTTRAPAIGTGGIKIIKSWGRLQLKNIKTLGTVQLARVHSATTGVAGGEGGGGAFSAFLSPLVAGPKRAPEELLLRQRRFTERPEPPSLGTPGGYAGTFEIPREDTRSADAAGDSCARCSCSCSCERPTVETTGAATGALL